MGCNPSGSLKNLRHIFKILFWKRTPLVIPGKVKPEDVENKWRTWERQDQHRENTLQTLTPQRGLVCRFLAHLQ